jgi:hypothetical protein
MNELVTKTDLLALTSDLQAVKSDLQAVKSELKADVHAVKAELQVAMDHAVALLNAKIETQTLRLTVRLGLLLAAAIALLASLLKLG